MHELNPQDEHDRKVHYIEDQLARGDRHPDDVKLLRETLHRLTSNVKRFIGRRPTPIASKPTAPLPSRPTAVRRSRAEEIAAQMAEAGRAAVDEHKGDDAA